MWLAAFPQRNTSARQDPSRSPCAPVCVPNENWTRHAIHDGRCRLCARLLRRHSQRAKKLVRQICRLPTTPARRLRPDSRAPACEPHLHTMTAHFSRCTRHWLLEACFLSSAHGGQAKNRGLRGRPSQRQSLPLPPAPRTAQLTVPRYLRVGDAQGLGPPRSTCSAEGQGSTWPDL